jgi:hypothetical protein
MEMDLKRGYAKADLLKLADPKQGLQRSLHFSALQALKSPYPHHQALNRQSRPHPAKSHRHLRLVPTSICCCLCVSSLSMVAPGTSIRGFLSDSLVKLDMCSTVPNHEPLRSQIGLVSSHWYLSEVCAEQDCLRHQYLHSSVAASITTTSGPSELDVLAPSIDPSANPVRTLGRKDRSIQVIKLGKSRLQAIKYWLLEGHDIAIVASGWGEMLCILSRGSVVAWIHAKAMRIILPWPCHLSAGRLPCDRRPEPQFHQRLREAQMAGNSRWE